MKRIILALLLSITTFASATNLQEVRKDYFISADTVIIGCTAGGAAGILAGSFSLVSALIKGIRIFDSANLLINLTGLGCGVGAVSGGVAILTAWFLDTNNIDH